MVCLYKEPSRNPILKDVMVQGHAIVLPSLKISAGQCNSYSPLSESTVDDSGTRPELP